jgi:hypothetical protein
MTKVRDMIVMQQVTRKVAAMRELLFNKLFFNLRSVVPKIAPYVPVHQLQQVVPGNSWGQSIETLM